MTKGPYCKQCENGKFAIRVSLGTSAGRLMSEVVYRDCIYCCWRII